MTERLTQMTADLKLKSISPMVLLIPAIVLVIACGHLPYGYYTFTRMITSGMALLIAAIGLREHRFLKIWSLIFLAIAALFNPVHPIYLHRSTWLFLDLATAAMFFSHLMFFRLNMYYGGQR